MYSLLPPATLTEPHTPCVDTFSPRAHVYIRVLLVLDILWAWTDVW